VSAGPTRTARWLVSRGLALHRFVSHALASRGLVSWVHWLGAAALFGGCYASSEARVADECFFTLGTSGECDFSGECLSTYDHFEGDTCGYEEWRCEEGELSYEDRRFSCSGAGDACERAPVDDEDCGFWGEEGCTVCADRVIHAPGCEC